MPLLWNPRTIPELAAVKRLPPDERSRIWGQCWPRVRRHWTFWAGVVVSLAVFIGVYIAISQILSEQGVGGFVNGAIAGGAGGLLGGTVFAQVFNRLAVPYLREELAKSESTDSIRS